MLAAPVVCAPMPVHAEQDGLLPRRPLDPGLVVPRATPLPPRLREPTLSPTDAARQVQRRHGGRVLSVQADGNGGYRVKVLKDGEVRIYRINP